MNDMYDEVHECEDFQKRFNHKTCKNYIPQNDGCILYYQLGACMNVQGIGCESRMTKKICIVEGCRECPFFEKGKQYVETPVNIDYYHHCLKSGAYHANIDGLFKTCILPNHRENDLNYVRVPKPTITYAPPDESKHPPKTINWGG